MQAGIELAGRYRLEEQLDEGGMGSVWRATDLELRREVAVKVLPDRVADPEFARRIRHEALVGARLRHPGITVVHDVGMHDGQPFIVMELLDGQNLAARLRDDWQEGLPVDQAISLTVQAAEALQAAHDAGVIHRDLKPANLFLQANGVLKICDFGIALAADLSIGHTVEGKVLGTAKYMSPEQCKGKTSRELKSSTDLYSLGCVLYALLTGWPPFAGTNEQAIMFQHVHDQPVRLRALRPDISAELDALVMRLLSKDPGERPSIADMIAEMTGTVTRTGLPVFVQKPWAHPDHPAPAWPVRPVATKLLPPPDSGDLPATRSRPRHQALLPASGAGAVIAVAAAILIAHVVTGSPTPTPSPTPEVQSGTQHNYQVRPSQLSKGRVPLAAPPPPPLPLHPEGRLRDPGSKGVANVTFSPDDRILAAGDHNGWTYLWRVGAHTIIGKGVHDADNEYIWGVVFSSDGKTFATADNHLNAVIRNTAGAQGPIAMLPGPDETSVFAIAYSPDNKILAVGDSDGNTYLWNAVTATMITALPDPGSNGVHSVAFNSQGTEVAVGDANHHAYLFSVASHRQLADLIAPGSGQVSGVAFSPDGSILAAADNNGNTYLWNVATGRLIATLPGPKGASLRSVAFSPFGRYIAVADTDRQNPVLLWNVVTHKLVAVLHDPKSLGAQSVAFSMDGNTLGAADTNGYAYLWDVSSLNL